ncbi:flavin monooxygenase-like protein [Gamsiella multidivaricata]|uniref:flavin monooxygenase-like protein n=1 Tax=Gamsiella multidivaricata TaxID=101098 RepID=UPI00221F56BE|nr:flavin monooxygenase-like protein [Gamsiella multidivaricata]KAG0360504.1 hypothetical protein BGZ54_009495 [Gamsiella multidivaricata]KAI7832718.1 flavin monooxygenase-like protein [Gamsiella multidivaricata]
MTPAATAHPGVRAKKRVAVIGAGCVGLAAIKSCLEEPEHLEVVGFEQESYSGGLWRYVDVTAENTDPHSSVYQSTIINTSKPMMTFSDYAIPGSWPMYLHNKKVVQYFDLYAAHFKLVEHIRFRTKVVEVKELKDEKRRWLVRSHSLGAPTPPSSSTMATSEIQEEVFDYVMMCTGHHSVPRYPSFPGMDASDPDAFTGQQMHSHFYRSPDEFKNKKVVVVGLGNSAVDLAVELSMNQSQVYLAIRSPIWVAPRWLFGKPLDYYTLRFNYFLPFIVLKLMAAFLFSLAVPDVHPLMRPKRRPFEAHTTINSILPERISTGTVVPKPNIKRIGPGKRVEFEDGTVVEEVDVIFWCTGYKISFPALHPEVLTDGHGDLSKNQVWLWNYMLPPRHPNLAFIGLFQAVGALMPVAELQTRLLVQVWSGKSKLQEPIPTDPGKMDEEILKMKGEIRKQYGDSPRHTIQVDFTPYNDKLAKQIGCFPSFGKLVRAFGVVEGVKLWLETIFGPPIPVHFRLVGPHAWVGDEDEVRGQGDEKAGEAARQAIWGYSGKKKYVDSKYLRDETEELLEKEKKKKNGVLVQPQENLVDL